MEPLFAVAAELWWLGPAALGGGAASVATLRHARRRRARRLEYDAARLELNVARAQVRTARAQAKGAQATFLAAKSEHQIGRGTRAEMDAARRAIGRAQGELRSARTALRGRRAQVRAARVMLHGLPRDDAHLPTARLQATHDGVISRWMTYETDPAKAIAFPAMSDARVPATSALLTAMDRARWLRPEPGQPLIAPEAFARYRAAVADLEAAFHAAETYAWRAAGAGAGPAGANPAAGPTRPAVPPQLQGAWDDLLQNARSAAATAAAGAAETALDAVVRAVRRAPHEGTSRSPRRSSD